MKIQYLIALVFIALFQSCSATVQNSETDVLLYNHLGYETGADKSFILQTHSDLIPDRFQVVSQDGQVVYEGSFNDGGNIAEWHTGKAYSGDFSSLSTRGSYKIVTTINNQTLETRLFRIEDQLIPKESLDLLISGIHSQRAAGEFNERDKKMSFYGERSDTVDVSGGWFDATGDRGKYLSHLSYANYMNPQQAPMVVWNFLEAYKRTQNYRGTDAVPMRNRLLEEAAYGADWLVRMQDPEGYFYINVFANWSWQPEQREISAYIGQEGFKNSDYEAGFREGGGISIAALARAANDRLTGEFTPEVYLEAAIKGFDHLVENNVNYIDDGIENIIDDYTALMAANELYSATGDGKYLDAARVRARNLLNRLTDDEQLSGFWIADHEGNRPFFHAAEAGLPIISLVRYLDIEQDEARRDDVIKALRKNVDFELTVTNQTYNPFGYARQYVKGTNETQKRTSFFIPNQNETNYWWQGENARISSLAAAMYQALPYLEDSQKKKALNYAGNQINWILGLNPFNMSMLDGRGHNNPEYYESGNQLNVAGCISNGITSGFYNEEDISFNPEPYGSDPSHAWRWGEQWLQHGSWFLLAVSSSIDVID